MMNKLLLPAFATAALFCLPAALATETAAKSDEQLQYDLSYKLQTGDVLRYEVEHRMSVRNTIDKETQVAQSETKSIKVWKIIDVMEDGKIELINLVDRVRMNNKLPDKEEMQYDSQTDATPPPGFEDAARAIGVPISVIRMSARGEIISREMKVHQPAADPDAPIAVRLPDEPVVIGDEWNQPIDVKVQLQGGGKKLIHTRRHFELQSVQHGIATIATSYQILSPINPHIEAQLVQRLMKGSIKFDMEAGRVISQSLEVDKRVLGYAGATSSMHYVMRMEEELLDDVPATAQKDRSTIDQ